MASVDARATQTAFMAGMVGMGLPGGKAGSVFDVVLQGEKLDLSSCIWLEFRDNFRGFRSECMLGADGPSALEGTNPVTGEKTDLGTGFDWYATGTEIHIRTDNDLIAHRSESGHVQKLTFRNWTLRLGQRKGDGYVVTEFIPAYDYTLPTPYQYDAYIGSFIGESGTK